MKFDKRGLAFSGEDLASSRNAKGVCLIIVLAILLLFLSSRSDYESEPPLTFLPPEKDRRSRTETPETQHHHVAPMEPPPFWADHNNSVTAIVLAWGRFKNLRCRNNNDKVALSSKYFEDLNCPKLRVYASPSNLYFYARYMACAMSETEHCFFQDDDWLVPSVRTLFSNYLHSPNLLHVNSDEDVFRLAHFRWCFFNAPRQMHGCFSWVGTGAFVPRDAVTEFMRLHSAIDGTTNGTRLADMYFGTYYNQMPYVLESKLVELPHPHAFSAGHDGIQRNKDHISRGMELVYEYMNRADSQKQQRQQKQEQQKHGASGAKPAYRYLMQTAEVVPNSHRRHVRAACARDDCQFLSNLAGLPHPAVHLTYKPGMTHDSLEHDYNAAFNSEAYKHHPYHHAVDENPMSYFLSKDTLKVGHFIGLDLLAPLESENRLQFSMVIDGSIPVSRMFTMEVSENGQHWDASDQQEHLKCALLKAPPTSGPEDTRQECKANLPGARFVRALSIAPWRQRIRVYDASATFLGGGAIWPNSASVRDLENDAMAFLEHDRPPPLPGSGG